jgi:hypothetical protein
MTNTYKATSPIGEHYYGEGVTEQDLTAVEEQDALTGGHLEIVPRTYKVLSGNYEGGALGEEFEGAYPVETEAALISGGHIERVDKKPAKSKPAAKAAEKKEQ